MHFIYERYERISSSSTANDANEVINIKLRETKKQNEQKKNEIICNNIQLWLMRCNQFSLIQISILHQKRKEAKTGEQSPRIIFVKKQSSF